MNSERGVALNPDRPAQAVDGQALDQVVHSSGFAVEKQIVPVRPHHKIEQALALWREQSGPYRQVASDIAGDQSLQECAHVLAGQSDERTIGQGGSSHGLQLGSRRDDAKPDHPPPRRLARTFARRRHASAGRTVHRASVRAGDRHAQPRAADHDYCGGRGLS